jgi:site-specific DNA recombinase
MPMRVATYTRISTDEEHQPYSLEAQDGRLRAYVESQDGWELVRSFTDQLSGASLERPGLRRALSEARAGRFDLLLVYRVDRLSRSVRGLAQVLEELDQAGVAFRSATEPFDTGSPAGRMMVQMLGVFAEFERATIIDRVIAGMERKAANGGWCGGRDPYGYRLVKGEGRLVVDEAEAPLVGVIFDRYVNRRLGSHALANWLNESGHRTRAGRSWSYKAVLNLLRNRTYLGEVHFRGPWHPSSQPPLVSEDLFEAAQALLLERGEDVSKRASNSSDYLLTGLVVCESCGRHFTGTAATGRNGTYRYYTCASRQRSGSHACRAPRLPADALDEAVVAALIETYERTDLFEEAAQRAKTRSGSARQRVEAELASVAGELAKIEAAIERYLTAFENGALPEATCGERVRALETRAADLRSRQADLNELVQAVDQPAPTPGELGELRDRVEHAMSCGSRASMKVFIQNLIAEIRVHDRDVIRPTFRFPGSDRPAATRTAVRAPSGSVGADGLEPPTCSL